YGFFGTLHLETFARTYVAELANPAYVLSWQNNRILPEYEPVFTTPAVPDTIVPWLLQLSHGDDAPAARLVATNPVLRVRPDVREWILRVGGLDPTVLRSMRDFLSDRDIADRAAEIASKLSADGYWVTWHTDALRDLIRLLRE